MLVEPRRGTLNHVTLVRRTGEHVPFILVDN
jgi:hypothetical protein